MTGALVDVAPREAPAAPLVVYVDRNAIHQNDQDGGDRPAILLEHPDGRQERVYELGIAGAAQLIQNAKPGQPGHHPTRPHVWLELRGPYRAALHRR